MCVVVTAQGSISIVAYPKCSCQGKILAYFAAAEKFEEEALLYPLQFLKIYAII